MSNNVPTLMVKTLIPRRLEIRQLATWKEPKIQLLFSGEERDTLKKMGLNRISVLEIFADKLDLCLRRPDGFADWKKFYDDQRVKMLVTLENTEEKVVRIMVHVTDRNNPDLRLKAVAKVPVDLFEGYRREGAGQSFAMDAYGLVSDAYKGDELDVETVRKGLWHRNAQLYAVLDCEDEEEREVRTEFVAYVDKLFSLAMKTEDRDVRLSVLRAVTVGNDELLVELNTAIAKERSERAQRKAEAKRSKIATLGDAMKAKEAEAQDRRKRKEERIQRTSEATPNTAEEATNLLLAAAGIDHTVELSVEETEQEIEVAESEEIQAAADPATVPSEEPKPSALAQRMLEASANGMPVIPEVPAAKPAPVEKKPVEKLDFRSALAALKDKVPAGPTEDK